MVLSYNQIDDFAQNIVDKAYPSDNCFPTSINIEKFLKEEFNVNVEYFTLSTDGTVLGMFASEPFFIKVWDGDAPVVISIGPQTIFIDSSLLQKGNLGRRNFTIAHEGAHHILNDISKNPHAMLYRYTGTSTDWNEWQANTLAACILMPRRSITRLFWMLYYREHIECISRLNKEYFEPLKAMANYYGVSIEALSIRLKKLGLVGNINLRETINIEKE